MLLLTNCEIMALNKANGNMYSWITHTWNTVKGECPHGCTYCYMKRWGKQKPVHFDESELKTDLGHGNFIFVGSSCDLFADDIPKTWITDTLVKTDFYTGNRYLFQSKNPNMFHYFMNYFPDGGRTSLCTTIETNRWYPKVMKYSPDPSHRAMWLGSAFWGGSALQGWAGSMLRDRDMRGSVGRIAS